MHRFVLVGTVNAKKLAVILDALGVDNREHPNYPFSLIEARMPLERLQNLRDAVDKIMEEAHV